MNTNRENCPNGPALAAFIKEELDASTLLEIEQHIVECESCQQALSREFHQKLQGYPDSSPFLRFADQNDSTMRVTENDEVRLANVGLPQIPGFMVLERLKTGGMGTVYLANEINVDRKVAIKFIRMDLIDKDFAERFETEQQLLASVKHPNIADFYQAGSHNQNPFFVMEFVQGTNFIHFCKDQQLTLRERLQLFLEICDAVQHLHSQLIIHRDLTPNNIMVTEVEGVPKVKVIDFGLAKLIAGNRLAGDRTSPNSTIGTLRYMSPEQTGGLRSKIDTTTDVYSLGILLYELLTGDTPLDRMSADDSSRDQSLRRIREEEAVTPSKKLREASVIVNEQAVSMRTSTDQLWREAKNDLDSIVLKAIRKEASGRYATASALGDDIRNYLEHRPVNASARSSLYLAKKFYKRNRILTGAVAAVALMLVAGIAGTSFGLMKAWAAEERAVELAEKETGARELAQRLRKTEAAAKEAAVEARLDAEKARKQAEDRRNKMQRASGILRAFFDGLNPEIAGAGDGKLRESMLERLKKSAADFLSDEVSEDDDVLLLKESLANSLSALGEPESAVPLWENITKEIQITYGRESNESIEAISNLAKIYWQVERFKEAKEQLAHAKEIAPKVYAKDDPQLLTLEHYYLTACELAGEIEFAYENRLKLMVAVSKLESTYPDLFVDSLNSQGLLELKLTKYKEAAVTLQKVCDAASKLMNEEHPVVMKFKANLALAQSYSGQTKESTNTYRELLASTQNQFPDSSLPVGAAKINLAAALGKNGQAKESIAMFEDIIKTQDKAWMRFRAQIELATLKVRVLDMKKEGWAELENLVAETAKELGEDHSVSVLARNYWNKFKPNPAVDNEQK